MFRVDLSEPTSCPVCKLGKHEYREITWSMVEVADDGRCQPRAKVKYQCSHCADTEYEVFEGDTLPLKEAAIQLADELKRIEEL